MKLKDRIETFRGLSIGVVGDIVADINLYGVPTRISREAPVLIVRHVDESLTPGGAGNAAANLAALGAQVSTVSIAGTDEAGDKLLEALSNRGIDVSGVSRLAERRTICKTRILAGSADTTKQQIIRIDREPENEVPAKVSKNIAAGLAALAGEADAILVSDYGYGVVSSLIVKALGRFDGIVVVDSRYGLARYRKLTAITPNTGEAETLSGVNILCEDTLRAAAAAIFKKTRAENLIITRGNAGMAVFDRAGRFEALDVHGPREITDVTGAGDTVAAVTTLALASGADIFEAAGLANVAAGIVVAKRGTQVASADELKAAL